MRFISLNDDSIVTGSTLVDIYVVDYTDISQTNGAPYETMEFRLLFTLYPPTCFFKRKNLSLVLSRGVCFSLSELIVGRCNQLHQGLRPRPKVLPFFSLRMFASSAIDLNALARTWTHFVFT